LSGSNGAGEQRLLGTEKLLHIIHTMLLLWPRWADGWQLFDPERNIFFIASTVYMALMPALNSKGVTYAITPALPS